jgi:hypothetical protein
MGTSRHREQPASSARQGAGIVVAAFACLLLAPLTVLLAPLLG